MPEVYFVSKVPVSSYIRTWTSDICVETLFKSPRFTLCFICTSSGNARPANFFHSYFEFLLFLSSHADHHEHVTNYLIGSAAQMSSLKGECDMREFNGRG